MPNETLRFDKPEPLGLPGIDSTPMVLVFKQYCNVPARSVRNSAKERRRSCCRREGRGSHEGMYSLEESDKERLEEEEK